MVKGYAYGVKNLSPDDEWSFEDLLYSYLGYWNNENLRNRTTWETTRYICFRMGLYAQDKKVRKPTDVMSFPWEDTNENKWTKEKIEAYKQSKFYKRK